MGAYFTTQIFKPDDSRKIIMANPRYNHPLFRKSSGAKFMESFFFDSLINTITYSYLFKTTNEHNQVVLSTVCDGDNIGDWCIINLCIHHSIYIDDNHLLDELKHIANQVVENGRKNSFLNHYLIENPFYLVCGTEYLDLQHIAMLSIRNNDLVCPLSILTRRSISPSGGGDMSDNMFKQVNGWIGHWFGKPLYATNNKLLVSDKDDITSKVVVYENY